MKAAATIVQVVGILLLAGSFGAAMFGTSVPLFLPGFILMFVGRAMRRSLRGPVPEPVPPPRERTAKDQQPEVASPSISEVLEELASDEREVEPVAPTKPEPKPRSTPKPPPEPAFEESDKPLSSAEMIARARGKWDRKT